MDPIQNSHPSRQLPEQTTQPFFLAQEPPLQQIGEQLFQNIIWGASSLTSLLGRAVSLATGNRLIIQSVVSGCVTEQEAVDLSLIQWVSEGDTLLKKIYRIVVAHMIRNAYNTHTSILDFTAFNIDSLPEAIGYLRNLEILHLCKNQLTTLPESIGNLTKLQDLYLNNNLLNTLPDSIGNLKALEFLLLHQNNLTALPDSIGNLTKLYWLDLRQNQLTELPDTIGNLNNLKNIYLGHNKLNTLPHTTGKLRSLEFLGLGFNQFSKLPATIGNLEKLEQIQLQNNLLMNIPDTIGNLSHLINLFVLFNPHLESLPMSLGNCIHLKFIDNRHTKIPDNEIVAIDERSKAARDEEGILRLSSRLSTWTKYSKINYDFNDILNSKKFHVREKKLIGEWLFRLENCLDFFYKKKQLAELVCKILETLCVSPQFKDTFFAQLEGNLERCGDRSSMLLNLIFTEWTLHSMDKNAKVQDKIALLAGLAKTLTLRNALNTLILSHEAKQRSPLHESVEIYLYYETTLKEKLGLVTAIEMSLIDIGNQPNLIEETKLIQHVSENYIDTLVELPALDKILKASPKHRNAYVKRRRAILASSKNKMSLREEEKEENEQKGIFESDGDYKNALGAIKKQRELDLAALRKKYVRSILTLDS